MAPFLFLFCFHTEDSVRNKYRSAVYSFYPSQILATALLTKEATGKNFIVRSKATVKLCSKIRKTLSYLISYLICIIAIVSHSNLNLITTKLRSVSTNICSRECFCIDNTRSTCNNSILAYYRSATSIIYNFIMQDDCSSLQIWSTIRLFCYPFAQYKHYRSHYLSY